MTQNAGDAFAQRAEEHDDAVRNGPQDEPEVIVAPDLLLTREARQVTDRALADRFYDRYKHLFINGDGQLHVYHKDRGAWSRDKAEVQVHAYCSHLSDVYYDGNVLQSQNPAAWDGIRSSVLDWLQ